MPKADNRPFSLVLGARAYVCHTGQIPFKQMHPSAPRRHHGPILLMVLISGTQSSLHALMLASDM